MLKYVPDWSDVNASEVRSAIEDYLALAAPRGKVPPALQTLPALMIAGMVLVFVGIPLTAGALVLAYLRPEIPVAAFTAFFLMPLFGIVLLIAGFHRKGIHEGILRHGDLKEAKILRVTPARCRKHGINYYNLFARCDGEVVEALVPGYMTESLLERKEKGEAIDVVVSPRYPGKMFVPLVPVFTARYW